MTAFAQGISTSALYGRWLHSFEEDTASEQVYRREGWSFPRSRGRDWFSFAADGSGRIGGPGADDRGASSPMRWSLSNKGVLQIEQECKAQLYKIRLEEDDKLIISHED